MSLENIKGLIPDIKESELKRLIEKGIFKIFDDVGRYEFRNRRLSGGIDGVYRIFLPESTFFSTLTATGIKDMVALETVTGETDLEYKRNFMAKILKKKRYRPVSVSETTRLLYWFSVNWTNPFHSF